MALKSSPNKKSASPYKKQETDKENNVVKKEETSPESTKQFKIAKRKTLPKQNTTETALVVCSSFASSSSKQSLIYTSPSQFSPITYDYSLSLPLGKSYMPYFPPLISPPCCYPVTNDWSSLTFPGLNPVYSFPVPPLPVSVFSPIFSAVCPMLAGQPLFADPVLPITPAVPIDIPFFNNNYEPVVNYNYDQIVPYQNDCRGNVTGNTRENINKDKENKSLHKDVVDPLEYYLSLPRTLFPTARMLSVDPNTIINEFCKEVNIQKHSPWILDLEFGIPSAPVTRPIAIYDVQFNSIHCKNTPGAIHPGFESCSQDFKKVCQFYYDCIISSWYRGYMVTNNDTSVANFQSWLQLPMQVFGMCWP